jgi:hypothetical protein
MTHNGEKMAASCSVLLIKRKIEVLDLIDFSFPLPGLDFHPGESVDRAHGDTRRLLDRSGLLELFGLDFNALIKV